jgi:hypothetical protein
MTAQGSTVRAIGTLAASFTERRSTARAAVVDVGKNGETMHPLRE